MPRSGPNGGSAERRRRQQFKRKRRRKAAADSLQCGSSCDRPTSEISISVTSPIKMLLPSTKRRRKLWSKLLLLAVVAAVCSIMAAADLTSNTTSNSQHYNVTEEQQQQQQQQQQRSQLQRLMKLKQKYETNQVISDTAYHVLLAAYSLLIITGTTFNSLICLTVLIKPKILSPRNIFIVNLAASDLLLCVFTMPFSFIEISTKTWHLGVISCKLVAGLQATSIFVSTISITAIALDRYKVIVYPVHQETHGRGATRRAALLLACVWIGALLLSSPLFYFRLVLHFTLALPQEAKSVELCAESWPLKHGRGIYSVISMILQYVLPITIVSVVYAKISDKLKKRLIRRQRLTQLEWQHKRQLTLIRRTHAMLISVSLIFGLSWLPLNLLNVIGDFSAWFRNQDEQLYKIIFAVCHLIGCSSACTNPILYAYLNENFRKECRQVYAQHASRLANAMRRWLAPPGVSGGGGGRRKSRAPDDEHNKVPAAASNSSLADKLRPEAQAAPSPKAQDLYRPSPSISKPPLLSLNGCADQSTTADDNNNNKSPPQPIASESNSRRCSTLTTASGSCARDQTAPFGAAMRFCLCVRGSSSIETLSNQQQQAELVSSSAAAAAASSSPSSTLTIDGDGTRGARLAVAQCPMIKMDQLSAGGRQRKRRSAGEKQGQRCLATCRCPCHHLDGRARSPAPGESATLGPQSTANNNHQQQGRRVWLRFLARDKRRLCDQCEVSCSGGSSSRCNKTQEAKPASDESDRAAGAGQADEPAPPVSQQQQQQQSKPLLKVAPINRNQRRPRERREQNPKQATYYLSIEPVVMLDAMSELSRERSTSLLVLDDDDDDDDYFDSADNVQMTGARPDRQTPPAQSMSRHAPASQLATDCSVPANRKLAESSQRDDKLIAKIPSSPECQPSELSSSTNSSSSSTYSCLFVSRTSTCSCSSSCVSSTMLPANNKKPQVQVPAECKRCSPPTESIVCSSSASASASPSPTPSPTPSTHSNSAPGSTASLEVARLMGAASKQQPDDKLFVAANNAAPLICNAAEFSRPPPASGVLNLSNIE